MCFCNMLIIRASCGYTFVDVNQSGSPPVVNGFGERTYPAIAAAEYDVDVAIVGRLGTL